MTAATATKKRATTKPATQAVAAAIGILIGRTLVDNEVHDLYLLPGEFEGNWKDAGAWAKKQGGELPSRIDALVLFERAKAEFKPAAYWTGTPYAGYDAYAWYQYFDDGYQNGYRKGTSLRARAVRTVKPQ